MSKQSILVPDIGAEQADVIEILVKPGQAVTAEQPIVVLESDKASMEVPCPQGGTVADIAVRVGQTVKQGDLLLAIETAVAPPRADAPGNGTSGRAPAGNGLPVAAIGKELNAVSDLLETGEAAAPGELAAVAPVAAAVAPVAATAAMDAAPATSASTAGASRIVRVPDIGAESADVIEVLVQEGQELVLEQPLVVLESAKASMEVPSPVAGIVRKVLVKAGDKVAESSPLLEVAVRGETPAPGPVAPAPAAATPTVPAVAGNGAVAPAAPQHSAALRALADGATVPSSAVHAGPAVRRLARELGVDLARVKGSGPRERILKEDVHAFVKQGMQQLAAGAAGAPGSGGVPALPVIDFGKWGAVERVPLTKIQRVSAQNLHRAWTTIPHVTQFDEADITELEAFRVSHKDGFKAEGLSLTLLSFMVKAVAHVLKEFPRFASSLSPDGETLVMKQYVHVGVAVDTPNGLVVPVIRDADRKSVRDIARDLGELSAKARDRKLVPADMQGACFSISSLGGIGGTAFTPLVNWPEVAILGVSRSALRPVWDGQVFRPRLMLPLSLSYDHRVIDGADAARFTTALARRLGDIRELLL